MSITSAMYTGISGLAANGEALGVIGNNISNGNTIGFKSSRTIFSDVLANKISGGNQVGRGVQVQDVQTAFSQGALQSTSSSTDLAIEGDSFFILQNPEGRFYSRAGSFSPDADHILRNPDGLQVLGYGITPASGKQNGILGPIDLSPFMTASPTSSGNVKVVFNLDSSETTPAAPWDPTDPVGTSNYSTSINVYDAQGNAHTSSLYFRKTGANTWDWHALMPDATSGGTIDGNLTFNSNGVLVSNNVITSAGPPVVTGPAATTPMIVQFPGGVAPQTLKFDFGENISTQYSNASVTSALSQDGNGWGGLTQITVDKEGYVNGNYSNGQVRRLYQVALAQFSNPNGLVQSGGTKYEASLESGVPQINTASVPGMGTLISNSLEGSNVDMSSEFVTLITTQRGFDANAKTITTADQMMQQILNLKQ